MIKIEYIDYEIPVYDITVKDNHNFFADGILVHNCLEVTSPTADLTEWSNLKTEDALKFGLYKPEMSVKEFQSTFGEITLCTLSALNWGNIKKPEDFEYPAELTVRALDALLDYQDYPMIAAEVPAKARRNLGIGIINFAHWLAKNGVKYGENLELVDEYMEAMYYYLMKANVKLAKERGHCDWYHDTIYSEGKFIHELRAPFIDTIVPHNPKQDWESLREEMKKYGVRHSVVVACMPAETSALISNATNGLEPPRSKVSVKGGKENPIKQVVPNIKLPYDFLWDQKTPENYLKTLGVIQKYTDQALSTNTSYNQSNFPDEELPMSQLMSDILLSYKLGLKTLYYMNQRVTTASDDSEQPLPTNGAVEEEVDCDGCKI